MRTKVTLIPGDGIGTEISAAMQEVVAAAGADIEWDVQTAGMTTYESEGSPLPARVIDSIRANKVCIKGPLTTPVGSGFRSINVTLRKEFDLFVNMRPSKTFLKSATFKDVDIIIFRENVEDLYAGIEFSHDSEETKELRALIKKLKDADIRPDAGISIKPISIFGSRRIVKAAFDYAVAHGRKKVTAIHKANIMKDTDGLFLKVAREVAAEYAHTGIEFEDLIVDAACMNLVLFPEAYDVLVLPNLYGDIVSDLCAGITGGLGLASSVNRGEEHAIFEAVHGSAPDIEGKGIANPTALIRSAIMMLDHIGEAEAARKIEAAIKAVIDEGVHLTGDIMKQEKGSAEGSASTAEYSAALIAHIKSA